jgi:hypothetical protein
VREGEVRNCHIILVSPKRRTSKLYIIRFLIGILYFPYKYETAYHSRKLHLVINTEKTQVSFLISMSFKGE